MLYLQIAMFESQLKLEDYTPNAGKEILYNEYPNFIIFVTLKTSKSLSYLFSDFRLK